MEYTLHLVTYCFALGNLLSCKLIELATYCPVKLLNLHLAKFIVLATYQNKIYKFADFKFVLL